ncbi:MAG: hypothetical protein J5833_07525 [Victivallales bacterium]|nr:hypothetical protein [Victivallales bacterium]
MNERQKALLERYKRHEAFPDYNQDLLRDVALMRAMEVPLRTSAQLRAATVLELTRITPFALEENALIAGQYMNMQWQAGMDGRDLAQDTQILRKYGVDASPSEVRSRREAMFQGRPATGPGDPSSDMAESATFPLPAGWGINEFHGIGYVENHSVRGYAKLLAKGFGGLMRDVQSAMEAHSKWSVWFVEHEAFYKSQLLVCEAGLTLGRRYAELAKSKGDTSLAENCLSVENGAKTFSQAVQLLWFGHLITCAEDGINANSIGRLDQILWPYYEKDKSEGRCTTEQAHELMVDLAIKLYHDYDVQAITLGGSRPDDGKTACNELTSIILDATADFGELRDLSLRVTRDMPDEILEKAATLVLRGGGIPFFFNDECFIPALSNRGIELEDARDYAPIGCVELTIPGKADSHAVSGWFNTLKILDLTIHGGYDLYRKQQSLVKCPKLEEYASFDDFYKAFWKNVTFFAHSMVYVMRRGELFQRNDGPQPFFSLLTENCLEKGRDITARGAKYNWHSICLMGVPNVADSLFALKKFVFDEKSIDAAQLRKSLADNFGDGYYLRQRLLNGAPKYGNGCMDVDDMAAQIARDFIALMDNASEPGSGMFVHLFSFYENVYAGTAVSATPDGRKAWEPFAYSLSAAPGRDKTGVTRMLESLAQMPHKDAAGGSAAIIDLHPDFFGNAEEAPKLLATLVKTAFFSLGVGQLQWNIVSAERMIQAQKDPEHYGNLQVRVAGYSQKFKFIERKLQDHLIARHKHSS